MHFAFFRESQLRTITLLFILLIAFALRISLSYPVPRYDRGGDSDIVHPGMCGMRVLGGYRPLMSPGEVRLGAQNCYVAAAALKVFGVSRRSLAFPVTVYGCLFAVFMFLYLREAFGFPTAFVGLLLAAVPPYEFVVQSYGGWTYGEVLMYSAAGLWLITFIANRKAAGVWFFALGLALGLSLWSNPISLMVAAPALFWLALRRGFTSLSKVFATLAGLLLGTLPLWIFLAGGGQREYGSNTLTRGVRTISQAKENLSYLLSTTAPWMLTGEPLTKVKLFSAIGLAIYSAGLAILFFFTLKPDSRVRRSPALLWQSALVGLLLLAGAGMYTFSFAGSVRGYSDRYIVPMYLAVPPAAAILFVGFQRIWRWPATLAILFLLALNLKSFPSFWPSDRRASVALWANVHDSLLAYMQRNQIDAVLGPYWDVYYLNFDSKGSVRAVPFDSDYDSVGSAVGSERLRWAVVARSASDLVQFQHRTGLAGQVVQANSLYWVFVPQQSVPEPADVFLKKVLDLH